MKSKLIIYHNPRCRKSREALNHIKESKLEYDLVLYLTDPLNESNLVNILSKLKIKTIELVRKNEILWRSQYSNKSLNDNQLISILVSNPKLIERPIIEYQDQAIIERPIEKLYDFLNMIKL